MNAPLMQLGTLVDEVSTWNPSRHQQDKVFTYIDLGAIDQATKAITDARKISCGDAPSRARQLVKAGDILVSTVRPNLNGVAIVADALGDATASTGFCVLRPQKDRLDGSYLFHWVKTRSFVDAMVKQATGASYPAISDKIIFSSKLPLPPLPEQRRIAAILDKADTLRAQRRAAIAKLDELLQSVFIEMFGDPLSNSKGWVLENLAKVTFFQEGPGILAKDFRDSGVPLIRLAGLKDGQATLNGCNFVDKSEFERRWSQFEVQEGDILVLTSATFGNPAVVDGLVAGSIFYTGIIRFRSLDVGLSQGFLKAFLASPWFLNQAKMLASGAVIKHFGPTHLKKMVIPLPPIQVQQLFTQISDKIATQKRTMQFAAEKAEMLFASLQQLAFSGKL